MVVSHLNKYIDYLETREIETEDIDEETDIYEIEIYKKNRYIAIGKPKYTYATKFDVVYFSIYLLKGFKKILGRIGVFEMEKNRLPSMKDNIWENLGEPLFFENTTEKYMEKTRTNVSISVDFREKEKEEEEEEKEKEEEKEEEEEDKEEKQKEKDDLFSLKNLKDISKEKDKEKEKKDKIKIEDVFTKDKTAPNTPSWPEETEEISRKMREEYIKYKSTKDNWVQSTMRNKNFDIQYNEGNGDCFFAVIRDAFNDIGYHTSVQKLRLLLSQEVNSDLLQQYHDIYYGIVHGQEIDKHEMDTISTTNQRLKKQAQKGGQSKQVLGELIAGAKELQKKYTEKKKKSKVDEELLAEFRFMEYVKTVDDFRNYIRTSDFWANTWAISTLEILLNIKIIILEESTDNDAIMLCGQLNSDISTFSPKYYIIVNYKNGNHYELITYKKKGLLTFQEIPYNIKVLIINKCMERNAGPYAIIPAFRDFKTNLGISDSIEEEEEKEKSEIIDKELYDDDIVFVFHSRSDATKKPGKGTGEKIPALKISDFVALMEDKNWRQQLDDDWITAFSIDGYRWSSVSHYLLAFPFKSLEPDVYKEFSLDGKDEKIAKDIDLARETIEKIKGKEGRFYTKYKNLGISKHYNAEEDTDFQNARKEALMAKFSKNADLNTLLRNTRKAKLVHFSRRTPAKIDVLLMEVRKKL
jgi:predicted NAD-dependent protein-ADP-ribosyltransferase YbiA (DUF1768 family)